MERIRERVGQKDLQRYQVNAMKRDLNLVIESTVGLEQCY
jgi:hypothetical protein